MAQMNADEMRALARARRPASHHLLSKTGMLHLRRAGNEDDGLSYEYARCGWENEEGKKAMPEKLDSERRVCRRCERSEP